MNQTNDLKNILNNTINENENKIDKIDKNNIIDKKTESINKNSKSSLNNQYNAGEDYIENMMLLLNIDKNNNNNNKNWSKLDKNIKYKLIIDYIDNFAIKNKLTKESKNHIKDILTSALYNNLLNKQSDIIYNKENGIIENITCLVFNTKINKYEINIKEKITKVTNKSKSNVTRLINSKSKSKSKNKSKNK
jgi:hypothetical protein